jgi:hypothetical protein
MLNWGIMLMLVGALSFLLPIFGRQFSVVSLVGLTGMGSGVAGIVLFGIGALLFTLGRRKPVQRDTHKIPDAPTRRAADPPIRESPVADGHVDPLRRESLFSDGCDGTIITEKAFALADAGDVKVQNLLAAAYLSGANGLPQDPLKAKQYFLRAAQQGDPFATVAMAGIYAEGLGVPQDLDRARSWAVKAKALGAPDAEAMLVAIDAKRRA